MLVFFTIYIWTLLFVSYINYYLLFNFTQLLAASYQRLQAVKCEFKKVRMERINKL